MLYLAMYGEKVSIGEALFISAFAMIVVFLVLLSISYMIDITAFFINRDKKKIKKENVVIASTKDSTKMNDNKPNDDVVVIAAAAAMYLGTTIDKINIKSIRRINQNNSAWSEKAMLSQIG